MKYPDLLSQWERIIFWFCTSGVCGPKMHYQIFFWKELKCEIAKGLFWRYNPLDPPRCRAILPGSSPAPRLALCMLALFFSGISEWKIHQYTKTEAGKLNLLSIYFYPTHQSWPYYQSIFDFTLVTVKNSQKNHSFQSD